MKKVIKKTKEKMKNNKELLLGLIVGLLISSAGVYAVEGYLYESDEVSYNDSKVNTVTLGADTVQGALDELNTRIEANCMKKTVTVQVVNGSVTGESTKQIKTGTQGSFTVSPDIGYGNGTVSCTNNQTATLNVNTLSITPTENTTCTVTYQINTYTVTASGSDYYPITDCGSTWSCSDSFSGYSRCTTAASTDTTEQFIKSVTRQIVDGVRKWCVTFSGLVGPNEPIYNYRTAEYEPVSNSESFCDGSVPSEVYYVSPYTGGGCGGSTSGSAAPFACKHTNCRLEGSAGSSTYRLVCSRVYHLTNQKSGSGNTCKLSGTYATFTYYRSATKTVTYNGTYGSVPTLKIGSWYTASSGGSAVTDSTTVTNASNHTIYAHG